MPSDLYEKYDCAGGFHKLEFDLAVASEIAERINEQTEQAQASSKAKRAVAKRDQRRATVSPEKMGSMLDSWVDE
tara:strand:- start:25 stop:249 length:225 start_codon:yes stop_codon:yes gene_type:complete